MKKGPATRTPYRREKMWVSVILSLLSLGPVSAKRLAPVGPPASRGVVITRAACYRREQRRHFSSSNTYLLFTKHRYR